MQTFRYERTPPAAKNDRGSTMVDRVVEFVLLALVLLFLFLAVEPWFTG